MKYFIFVLCIILSSTVLAGKLYRCKDESGLTSFQQKPCKANQKTVTQYQYTKANKEPQCNINCDASYRICVSNVGVRNAYGVTGCSNEKQLCRLGCDNPQKAAQIRKNIARQNKEQENEHKMDDMDRKMDEQMAKQNKRMKKQEQNIRDQERKMREQERKMKRYERCRKYGNCIGF